MVASLGWRIQWGTFQGDQVLAGRKRASFTNSWVLLFLENPYLLPRPCVIWENSAADLLVCFLGCPAVQLLTDELRGSQGLCTQLLLQSWQGHFQCGCQAQIPHQGFCCDGLKHGTKPFFKELLCQAFLGMSQQHQGHLERDGGRTSPTGP